MEKSMDIERNLLFGALAVRTELLSPEQFSEAYQDWSRAPEGSLADTLQARGLLSPENRRAVESDLATELARHGGDVQAALKEVEAEVQQALGAVREGTLRQTIAGMLEAAAAEPIGARGGAGPASAASPERRYQRLRKHAAGGIGQVWLARDEHLEREVALKELRPESAGDGDLRRRFLDEAHITGQLEHPGVVPVYELSEETGEPFYVMRFIRGRTLSTDIQAYHRSRATGTASPLGLNDLLQAFAGVCNAVAYAHSRGFIHRDLKGANVVLGDFGEVIVLDWGLAKRVGEKDGPADAAPAGLGAVGDTLKGQVLGTPAYMAPEQAAGGYEEVNQRADVYSLGAILYEILTGQPPFTYSLTIPGRETRQALDVHDLFRRIREETPPRPRNIWPGAPPALEAICLKALAKKPTGRYASAADLARDLKRWLADEPVEAYPEPLRARVGRWARRHKPVVAGLAVLLVAAVVALTASTILIGREQKRTEAMAQKAEENFRQARAVVDRFFVKISEDRLLNEPGLQPLRLELLQMARAYYENFQRDHENDPDVGADLARTQFDLAGVLYKLGESDAAMGATDKTLELFEKLSVALPRKPELRLYIGKAHNRKGMIYLHAGQEVRAERSFAKAREVLEELAADHPDDDEAQTHLGNSLGNLGMLYLRQRKTNEALAALQADLRIRQSLAKTHPKDPAHLDELAASHTNLGNFLIQALRKRDQAEEQFQNALEIHDELAKTNPKVIEYQRSLAKSFLNLARIKFRFGGPSDTARALLDRALDIRKQIARKNPNVTEYQKELAFGYMELGEYLSRSRNLKKSDPKAYQEETAKAEKAYVEARKIFQALAEEYPTVLGYAADLACSYAQLGNVFHDDGDLKVARSLYLEALRRGEPIFRKDPNNLVLRNSLRNAYWGLAEQPDPKASLDQVRQYWRRALELDDGANRSRLRAGLHQAWLRLVKHWADQTDFGKALPEADALAREAGLPGSAYLGLATICRTGTIAALAAKDKALAAARADKAIALLLRAEAAGFFKGPMAAQLLAAFGDVPVIKDHPQFVKLLGRVRDSR
jgi:serine/threonine-protein kinase